MRKETCGDGRLRPSRQAKRGGTEANSKATRLRGHRALDHQLYFKLNNAFTCAVTVTVCGVNSSVGAGGAALAMADIARAI